jgi:tRNA 2-selenouridine synthase
MKDARPLTIDEVVERLDEFDAILDARSPSEHAEDHLPTALSTPVLDDAQRALIGTMHKQQGAFEAKRAGAALVARNIADLLEQRFATMPRDWRPLVYCWRGGNRSGALATILARIGWQTSLLTGGYREFRRRVIADLTLLPARFRFVVITGRTGSGKTLLLERLAALGEQALDLEGLARHRGSVLGNLPGQAQPSQKRFETLLWDRLRNFSSDRPVFVESESRKVGQCQVPEHLILAMRGSACANIDTPDPVRSALLLRDYRHFVDAPARLAERLEALIPLHGRTRIEGWLAAASAGQWDEFVFAMLREHYDPAYDKSMLRNFSRLEQAVNVSLDAADPEAVDRAAKRLIELSRINPG